MASENKNSLTKIQTKLKTGPKIGGLRGASPQELVKLPSTKRRVFKLHVSGMEADEIAQYTGIDGKSVKRIVKEAKQKIAEEQSIGFAKELSRIVYSVVLNHSEIVSEYMRRWFEAKDSGDVKVMEQMSTAIAKQNASTSKALSLMGAPNQGFGGSTPRGGKGAIIDVSYDEVPNGMTAADVDRQLRESHERTAAYLAGPDLKGESISPVSSSEVKSLPAVEIDDFGEDD